jgi:ankyrin repeat protein
MAASASSKKRKKSLSSNLPYLDCTAKCQLFDHARVIIKIAALGNVDLLRHSVYLCGNPWNVCDGRGLTALHVASSLGHLKAVDWLLKKKSKLTIINSPDHESKWTSLHRAAYYGHPHVMISLIKGGANVTLLDNDGCSPLNLLQLNFNLADTYPAVSEVILYMWGTNINMTLGHHHCRSTPEISEALPPLINISQVWKTSSHFTANDSNME